MQTMSREESVRWLVNLTKVKPGEMAASRPGDLPNLLFDLRRFLEIDSGDKAVEAALARARTDPLTLQPVIALVSEMLACTADRSPFRYAYHGGVLVFDAGRFGHGRLLAYHDSTLADAVIQVAAEDLNDPIVRHVRRCANPDCRQIFFAARESQTYCGHRCANVVASRKYREQNRKKRAAHARARYREKLRQRAPGLKIGRK